MYIWNDDTTGKNIANALLKNKQADISIEKDTLGMGFVDNNEKSLFSYRSYFDSQSHYYKLRKSNNITISNRFKRNHSKIIIIDDKILFLGGRNIANEYNTWKDYSIRVKSKFISFIFKRFNKPTDTNLQNYTGLAIFPIGNTEYNKTIHSNFKQQLFTMLDKAVKQKLTINIEMAYFGDIAILKKIKEVSQHTKVNIVTSNKTDNYIQQIVNQSSLNYLLHNNKKVHIYLTNTLIHSKLIFLSDSNHNITDITIGSYNFHPHTKALREINMQIECHGTCSFQEDLNLSFYNNIKNNLAKKSKQQNKTNRILTAYSYSAYPFTAFSNQLRSKQ